MVLRRRRCLLRVFIRDVPHADHRREGDPLAGLGIDINLKKSEARNFWYILIFLKKKEQGKYAWLTAMTT